ncbi:KRRI-Interacting protein 1 [Puttea exsequens]|nr:KRRI-Interacting protein 1 [Puttea exsequens]
MATDDMDLLCGHASLAKRRRPAAQRDEKPYKKVKALFDYNSTSEEGDDVSSHGGVPVNVKGTSYNSPSLTVNQEYAKRFEYNKKREECQRLERKYGTQENNATERSSSSEEEDDDGLLVSEALDSQIQDALDAIRKKDPRVYNEKTKFYTELSDEDHMQVDGETKRKKAMYLSDYHRKNLLEDAAAATSRASDAATYVQQQHDLKTDIVKEMHAATNAEQSSDSDDNADHESIDGFLTRKPPNTQLDAGGAETRPIVDVENADKDPETFLSNFMLQRAWVHPNGSRLQPFESDDEDEDHRAELFEEAYNMRFEDPSTANEKLVSHARDTAAKYSVRKEPINSRKRAREAERAKTEAARQFREEEKARLRKLKVAEAEAKVKKIKEAAGLRGQSLREDDWSAFLEEGWDDGRWDVEMKKRFGDDYYADHDLVGYSSSGNVEKEKIKKPKWQDDIYIGDIAPDLEEAEGKKPPFALTDDELEVERVIVNGNGETHFDAAEESARSISGKTKSNRGVDDRKKETRLERRKIERLVNEQMDVDEKLTNFGKKHAGHFRYRETSPMAYGLTPQDILMASDSQLNQYAGLKKMATFRDPDKKRKDKKHLGKKARLRQWRKDTFGNEKGPQKTLAELLDGQKVTTGAAGAAMQKAANDIEYKQRRTKKSQSRTKMRSGI